MSNKEERQVAAAKAKTERTLKQVYSLTDALLRSITMMEGYAAQPDESEGIGDETEFMATIRRVETNEVVKRLVFIKLHFATLYSVVEKWEEWKFYDSRVASILTAARRATLKEYRNSIFHADHFDAPDKMRLLNDPDNGWTIELSFALRDALRQWHSNFREQLTQHLARTGIS